MAFKCFLCYVIIHTPTLATSCLRHKSLIICHLVSNPLDSNESSKLNIVLMNIDADEVVDYFETFFLIVIKLSIMHLVFALARIKGWFLH